MIFKILNMTEEETDKLTPWGQVLIGVAGLLASTVLLTAIIMNCGG